MRYSVHMWRQASFTAQRNFGGLSLDQVQCVAAESVVELGFKIRSSGPLHVSAYTGWRWASALGFGELIEVNLARDIDHVRVDVTSRQARVPYGGSPFDLAGRNRSNVAFVLEHMESSVRGEGLARRIRNIPPSCGQPADGA